MSILMKLGPIEILEASQFVCKSWHNLCKDPAMWRTIDMQNLGDREFQDTYLKMTYSAIDRSNGGLRDINIEDFGDDDLLKYIALRLSGLKCLRLACCYFISDKVFTDVTTKLSLLEEVELTLCLFTVEAIKAVGRNCPLLKTFKLNHRGVRHHSFAVDEEALAISETMPQLHHLQLIGNGLTTTGLEAIINSCLHLKSLDLRACFHISLGGTLWKRCVEQIKDLRLPNDPTDDYKFVSVSSTDYESDSDDGMLTDVELLSDIEEYNESSDDEEFEDYDFWYD
ncbi:hypothetical protein Ancab_021448 [Ancistrocladus abbreviatus]